MSKRMGYSVIGLPHYTIWHLYEPSIDDIRRMDQMEKEKKQQEEHEKVMAERAKLIKQAYKDPRAEWEKDGAEIQNMIQRDKTQRQKQAQKRQQGDGSKGDNGGSHPNQQ